MIDVTALRVRGYLGCVYVLGAGALVAVVITAQWQVPRHAWGVLGVTIALLIVGELLPIRLWRQGAFDEYTFSGTFALALLATGPIVYGIAAQLMALLIEEFRHRKPVRVVAFNVAQYVLMFVSARLAIAAVNNVDFGGYAGVTHWPQLLSLVIAAPIFFGVNACLHGTVVALTGGVPVGESVARSVRDELPITPMVLGFAPVVIASLDFSVFTAPLCLLPMIAVRRAATMAAEHEIASLHDPLTGLPNRSLLQMRLGQALDERAETGAPVAVLMLDLDHFKEINDTLGHPVGDALLTLVAARLAHAVRPGDTVARLGGDEFAVLACDITADAAEAMAKRLNASLSQAFRLVEVSLNVEASVGISLAPQHGVDAECLIRYADVALHLAKQERGGHVVYDPRSDQHSIERLALMGALREGIERRELVVYYQPKISTRTGRIRGVEALVRWQHPTLGLLAPGRFMPAAENTALIVPLTKRVIDDALAAVRQWRSEGLYLTVAVNVTARHIANLDLPAQINGALAAHDLPGSVLVVEVTESCLMADPVRTRIVLGKLREAGIKLSIDDFGTGYSSFANLLDLPVNEIKIDRSFVSAATVSAANAAIVKSTVDLGHSLGLEVVAEGVETIEGLELLTDMGCDLIQGFLYSPAIPASEIPAWAASRDVMARDVMARDVMARDVMARDVERITATC